MLGVGKKSHDTPRLAEGRWDLQHQLQEDAEAGAGDKGVGGFCGREPHNPGERDTQAPKFGSVGPPHPCSSCVNHLLLQLTLGWHCPLSCQGGQVRGALLSCLVAALLSQLLARSRSRLAWACSHSGSSRPREQAKKQGLSITELRMATFIPARFY